MNNEQRELYRICDDEMRRYYSRAAAIFTCFAIAVIWFVFK